MSYCILGTIDGYTRYGLLERGVIVATQISRPDGQEQPYVRSMKFKPRPVEYVSVKEYLFNNPAPIAKAGEQPRRPTWRRAGKRVAQ